MLTGTALLTSSRHAHGSWKRSSLMALQRCISTYKLSFTWFLFSSSLLSPSADNVRGFWERFRVERGQEIGPRIFQVGDVIYGAGAYGIHQDITTMEEAYAALIRIKVEGGPASYSYKNYNLPSRASRQRLLLAARNMSMLCVPEGVRLYNLSPIGFELNRQRRV